MNRKSAIILIMLAAIFAAVIYTLLIKEPLIEKVIITEKKSLSEAEMQSLTSDTSDDFVFNNSSGIYAIFIVKNLKTGNTINIKWFKVKDSKEELMQDDSVTTKKEGSGQVATGFTMKNDAYEPGNYRMEYSLDAGTPISVSFSVK
jgi:LPS O-antigen subunit length determinant protein (WzzB/FepE family)